MAKKTRKQKQRAALRSAGASVAYPTATAPTGVAVEAEDLQPAPSADDAAAGEVAAQQPADQRRRVERVSPSGAPVGRSKPGRTQVAPFIRPLDSDDAAIPFDRVPYVPADLRRVAVIAALMIALIIVADIVVSNVVK
ncbi:MAG TPA: hypothetical protein VLO10_06515 [Candidatus Deferrimicrobium sp.]|nr:hypothetical protein [Candidatus Deferrimicrobium sp.]